MAKVCAPLKEENYNLFTFFLDGCFTMRNLSGIKEMYADKDFFDFRERMMLLVTGIYGCRQCVEIHEKAAKKARLTPKEQQELLKGSFKHAPKNQKPALAYTKKWALANTTKTLKHNLHEHYNPKTIKYIELTLRIIRAGNLAAPKYPKLMKIVLFIAEKVVPEFEQ